VFQSSKQSSVSRDLVGGLHVTEQYGDADNMRTFEHSIKFTATVGQAMLQVTPERVDLGIVPSIHTIEKAKFRISQGDASIPMKVLHDSQRLAVITSIAYIFMMDFPLICHIGHRFHLSCAV
jgi:hypothetical protein